MKFFGICFLVLTAIAGFFWATDGAGSGMAIPTIIFAVLGIAGFVGEALRKKSLKDKAGRLNSFALPLLLAIQLSFSGWWLVLIAIAGIWAWAILSKDEGMGDYGRGIGAALRIMFALVATVCLVVGCGMSYWLR